MIHRRIQSVLEMLFSCESLLNHFFITWPFLNFCHYLSCLQVRTTEFISSYRTCLWIRTYNLCRLLCGHSLFGACKFGVGPESIPGKFFTWLNFLGVFKCLLNNNFIEIRLYARTNYIPRLNGSPRATEKIMNQYGATCLRSSLPLGK